MYHIDKLLVNTLLDFTLGMSKLLVNILLICILSLKNQTSTQ